MLLACLLACMHACRAARVHHGASWWVGWQLSCLYQVRTAQHLTTTTHARALCCNAVRPLLPRRAAALANHQTPPALHRPSPGTALHYCSGGARGGASQRRARGRARRARGGPTHGGAAGGGQPPRVGRGVGGVRPPRTRACKQGRWQNIVSLPMTPVPSRARGNQLRACNCTCRRGAPASWPLGRVRPSPKHAAAGWPAGSCCAHSRWQTCKPVRRALLRRQGV